jgi:hypothetical protein
MPRAGTARENFVRLAEARTNRILKDLDLLANLANRANYVYTEEDVRQIFKVVTKKVTDAEARFRISKKAEKEFRLA